MDAIDRALADTEMTVGDYLDRIGVSEEPRVDLAWLQLAQRAHLATVPFENFDVFDTLAVGVDNAYCLDQVVTRRRGGWCFVVNGAFAALLEAVGFRVRRLGAAVLLGGPSTVIDHECLEVETPDGAMLIDVGFGDRGPTVPLPVNSRQAVDDGIARFTFVDSVQGLTLTRSTEDELIPLYRFRRVTLAQDEFDGPSLRLQADAHSPFRMARFASVLTESPQGPVWLTLTDGERKLVGPDGVSRASVDETTWRRLAENHLQSGWPSPGGETSSQR